MGKARSVKANGRLVDRPWPHIDIRLRAGAPKGSTGDTRSVQPGSRGNDQVRKGLGSMATLTYRDAVGRALQDSLRAEPRLILIGQNIAGYTLKQLAEEFGENRIRDTSISESAMVGIAVGAAMKGWKAVVMIAYADISSVCHKAIVQSAAKMHYLTGGRLQCPVVIRLPIARFRGHGPMGNEVAVSW